MDLGEASAITALSATLAGAELARHLETEAEAEATLLYDAPDGPPISGGEVLARLVLGMRLRNYRFAMMAKADTAPQLNLTVIADTADEAALSRSAALAEGVTLARSLVNMPASHLNPDTFADHLAPLHEAGTRHAYRMLVCSDGAKVPFADGYFASAVSNSVLEHIPHVDEVLVELARVLRKDGRFVFCVPNHRFPQLLLGTQTFEKLGMKGAAERYTRFFQRISRHQHCDSLEVWQDRLARTGFAIDKHWDYFSADALHQMEIGHAFGVPALVSKKLTNRWVLARNRVNLWLPYRIARGVFHNPIAEDGVYSFYIARRV